jgi:hypothetical protein
MASIAVFENLSTGFLKIYNMLATPINTRISKKRILIALTAMISSVAVSRVIDKALQGKSVPIPHVSGG